MTSLPWLDTEKLKKEMEKIPFFSKSKKTEEEEPQSCELLDKFYKVEEVVETTENTNK